MRFIFIFLFLLLIITTDIVQSQSLQGTLENADSLLRAGNLDKSLNICDHIINTDSSNVEAYYVRAKVKMLFKSYDEALKDIKIALEVDPTNSLYLLARASIHDELGYFNLSENDYNKAIEFSEGDFRTFYARGLFYTKRKKYHEAIRDLSKCIELDSSDNTTYLNRGTAYSFIGKNELALHDYNKSIELDSTNYLSYYNRSLIFHEKEDMFSFCEDCKNAIKFYPKIESDSGLIKEISSSFTDYCDSSFVNYYYHRGIAEYNKYNFEKSVGHYNLGLEKFENHPVLLTVRGNAYLELKMYVNAINDYKQANKLKKELSNFIKLNPRFSNTPVSPIEFADAWCVTNLINIVLANKNLGNFSEAKEYLGKAKNISKNLSFNPDYLKIPLIEGEIYLAQNRLKKARLIFTEVFNIDNKNPYIYESISRLFLFEELTPKYISFERLSSILNHEYFSAYNIYSVNDIITQIRKNGIKEKSIKGALANCDKAIELDANFAKAYFTRAFMKVILNRKDYIFDLHKAKELGITNAFELLGENHDAG